MRTITHIATFATLLAFGCGDKDGDDSGSAGNESPNCTVLQDYYDDCCWTCGEADSYCDFDAGNSDAICEDDLLTWGDISECICD